MTASEALSLARSKVRRPEFSELKLFALSIAGFGDFLPLPLECFVMYVCVRRLIRRRAREPIPV